MHLKRLLEFCNYRMSHSPQLRIHFVLVVFQLPVLVQRIILPLFNNPEDEDSETTLKIDDVAEQNVRQTGFRDLI